MTVWQRIQNIVAGVVMILLSALLMIDASHGFRVICFLLCAWLFIYGIKCLIFYQTMARHMVGGRMQFYRGIILLDFGIFTLSLTTIPKAYIVLYLIGIHAFAGVVDILRAHESKKMEAPGWKTSMISGLANLIIALVCISVGFVQKSDDAVVYIYAAGLFYSGCIKLISAFKRTAIVYIQ